MSLLTLRKFKNVFICYNAFLFFSMSVRFVYVVFLSYFQYIFLSVWLYICLLLSFLICRLPRSYGQFVLVLQINWTSGKHNTFASVNQHCFLISTMFLALIFLELYYCSCIHKKSCCGNQNQANIYLRLLGSCWK